VKHGFPVVKIGSSLATGSAAGVADADFFGSGPELQALMNRNTTAGNINPTLCMIDLTL
jgi:hypothetical protein